MLKHNLPRYGAPPPSLIPPSTMVEFPCEDDRTLRLRTDFADHFSVADRLLRFWLCRPKDEWVARSRLPDLVLNLAMVLNVQACRQFRSVIEECGRGEGFCANIISRSLFETILAQRFILAKRVCIVAAPMVDSANGKHLLGPNGIAKYSARLPSKSRNRTKNDWLPRRLRASLYCAHLAFADERRASGFARVRGLKRSAARMRNAIDSTIIAQCEQSIGPAWSYILSNHPRTYSGLTLDALAKSLHNALHRWYETVYRIQSGMVHAADALRHLDIDENGMKGMYVSPESEAIGALETAAAMFFTSIQTMQANIGFGPAVEIALHSFSRELHATFAAPA